MGFMKNIFKKKKSTDDYGIVGISYSLPEGAKPLSKSEEQELISNLIDSSIKIIEENK